MHADLDLGSHEFILFRDQRLVLEKMQYSLIFVTIVFLSVFNSRVGANLSCEKCDVTEEFIEATKKLNDCEKIT